MRTDSCLLDKQRIRVLFMDVDGTLTDGKIHIGNNGEVFKSFDVKDGYGISQLLPPIIPVVITSRNSEITEFRCKELGIEHVYQNQKDKHKCMIEFLCKLGMSGENAAYIGDDLSDLECMRTVSRAGGIVGCPSDADDKVKEISDFISVKPGGKGAVREFIAWLKQYNDTECASVMK